MRPEQWADVLRVNLGGVFNLTQNVIAGMIDRGYGRVVNISSINGQTGQFGQTNYSAAKAGMHGFPMALAREEIGRASCRERVCQYVSISVVAVSLKNKTYYFLISFT